MPIDDRSDIQQTSPRLSTPGNSSFDDRGMSPSLTDQTPGLDKTSRLRGAVMRPVSYARERPAIVLSIVGGLVVLGIGTWLALRTRRPTRWQMMKDYGTDAYEWVRSKI
jgi:hypothetical protein